MNDTAESGFQVGASFGEQWQIKEDIAVGGCHGKVFKIVNTSGTEAAIKVYSIRDNDEVQLKRKLDFHLKEIGYMSGLKQSDYVVALEDYACLPVMNDKNTVAGYDLILRMPFLNNLEKAMRDGRKFEECEAVQLGVEICQALIDCNRMCGIMHRDIKPANLFFSNSHFQLGDFGTAVEIAEGSLYEPMGSPAYSAPEIYLEKWTYDSTIDLYSLSLVMYRMLNNNCLPFTNERSTYEEHKTAIERRCSGETIPPVKGISREMNNILGKGFAFSAGDRYPSPCEMQNALLKYLLEY